MAPVNSAGVAGWIQPAARGCDKPTLGEASVTRGVHAVAAETENNATPWVGENWAPREPKEGASSPEGTLCTLQGRTRTPDL